MSEWILHYLWTWSHWHIQIESLDCAIECFLSAVHRITSTVSNTIGHYWSGLACPKINPKQYSAVSESNTRFVQLQTSLQDSGELRLGKWIKTFVAGPSNYKSCSQSPSETDKNCPFAALRFKTKTLKLFNVTPLYSPANMVFWVISLRVCHHNQAKRRTRPTFCI